MSDEKTSRTVPFTDRWLKALHPPARGSVEYFDTAGSGFGLRVFAGGTKSFFVVYRRYGRKRRLTLGRFPKVSLSKARQMARKVEANRLDPLGERERVKEAGTFEAVALDFLEDRGADFRESSIAEYRRIVTKTLIPRFGELPVGELDRGEVKAFLRGLAKDAPIMANRVHSTLRLILNYAVREERLEVNPLAGLDKPAYSGRREPTRERYLSQDEIRLVWKALDEERPLMASYFRLLLLLGTRKRETLNMRWSDLDLDEALWTIPNADAKTGNTLEVPLSPQAVRVVEGLRVLNGHKPHVFTSHTGEPVLNPNRAKLRISKRSKVQFRIHDLRRTVATHLARIGTRSETVSAILGHVVGGSATTRIYERWARLPEKRAALERWAVELDRIVMDEDQGVAVVEFRR